MSSRSSVRDALLSLALVIAAVLGGCSSSSGSSADCSSLCSAAQSGKCTSIKGDCGKFCAALDAVDPKANCSSQYAAYESCLGSPETVCSTSCDSKSKALSDCIIPYCA